MKHHPIIFAAGEGVPVISLNYHEYYRYKNNGALDILGIGGWSVDLESQGSLDSFTYMFRNIKQNRQDIVNLLADKCDTIREKLKLFEDKLKEILEEG